MDARTSILSRLYVVLTLLAVLPVLVAAQMVRIYVEEGKELREAGLRQASSYIAIPAHRGSILDRAGRTLAMNTASYEVALDPTRAGFDARADELYAALARATGRPAGAFRQMVASRASRQYVLLHRELGGAHKETLEALNIPGLILTPRFARRYTYGRTGAHVVGHVDPDLRGLAGIELQYDPYLRGIEGRQAVQRDRRGLLRAVVDGRVTEPVHGNDLTLTLDLVLQSILQEELARGVAESGASWGAAIAMDPHTGAILAMANVPDYDPNSPGAVPERNRRNYAITDQIEPGSTFKLVTAVAALEAGGVSPSDSIDTGAGWAVFGGRTMRDSRAYGRLSFTDAITVSSNVAFARMGTRVEPGTFYQYVRNFGFGQQTLIDLPGEESGRIHRPENWSGSTQSSMSIGYALAATPLQLLTAYAALANGGLLVRPHVVAERRDMVTGRVLWRAPVDSVRRAFRPATADTLRPIFERVVSRDGTARRAMVEGLRIAGKTGTARIAQGGQYIAAYRGSFVGVFPAEQPEVALIVVLDRPVHGYFGGTVAAPIFGRIAERWASVQPALLGRRTGDPLAERVVTSVPDVRGLPQRVASARLRAAGLLPVAQGRRTEEAWRTVSSQRPLAGDTIAPRRPVRLAAQHTETRAPLAPAEEPATAPAGPVMPDVRGLSARHAAAWLAQLGAAPRLPCTGTVVRQDPEPGAPITAEPSLTCR